MRRCLTFVLALLLLQHSTAHADDYGPHRDLRDVRTAARQLLAHRLREQNVDPSSITISDVVVVNNQAMLSWHRGSETTAMGLVRYANRWWDAYDGRAEQPHECDWQISNFPLSTHGIMHDIFSLERAGFSPELIAAANAHNPQFRPATTPALPPSKAAGPYTMSPRMHCDYYDPYRPAALQLGGGKIFLDPASNGYDAQFTYAGNDAVAATLQLRARAPSPAEILDFPSPPPGARGSTGVLFLYFDLDSKAPVSFAKGSKFDVWVPWVVDDGVRYELEIYEGPTVVGPIKASVFDNVLHFELPPFRLPPGETLGEIDGYW